MHTFANLLPANHNNYNTRSNMRKYNEAMYQMEMQTWRPYRLFGLFSSFCAMSFTTISICNNYWFISNGFNAGIWNICFYNVTRTKTEAICSGTHHYWQNAVIGLLIFSVAFGFLATVLSICGFITTQLAKKIYYYHSAGEIYLICAMSCIAALVVYPVALEVDDEYGIHSFGVGYGLGWGASFFFITSALCMCLDDLVRAFARGACRCCGQNNENDTRV